MRRLACAVLVLGCSNAVYAPFSGGGGSDQGIIGGTTVIGGMSNPDLSTPRDLSLEPGTPSGTISVKSATQSRLSAAFTNSTCAGTTVAGCLLRDCPPDDMAVAGHTFNVGSIHAVAPAGSLSVAPQSDGTYLPVTFNGQLWTAASAMVTVSGSGADYPAFSIMLAGPTPITVVNPLSNSFDLPRSADFEVDWTGGSTGQVTVELATATKSLSCDFAVAAASGKLPGSALAMLPAGSATMTLSVAGKAVVDSVISVRAEVAGLDSGGLPFSANVNLR